MKKRYLIIFCAVFLLIPTYIVISILLNKDETPVYLRDINETVIVSPLGDDYSVKYDKDNKDSTLFYDMFAGKTLISSISSTASTRVPYVVSFNSEGYTKEYEYIFTESPDECYIIDRDGVSVIYYKIAKDLAATFLNSDFSKDVYLSDGYPVMTVNSKFVAATGGEWNWRIYSGELRSENVSGQNEEYPVIGSVASDFDLRFSREPSNVTVTVKDKETGELLYEGEPSGAQTIETKYNYDVLISVNAEWNDLGKTYGKMEYVCVARLFAPAYVFLSEPQCKEGGLVVLSVKNVLDIDSLEFSCEPSLGFEPTFYKDGDYYRALIPVPLLGLKENTVYTMKLKCDDILKTADLVVTPRSDSSVTVYNISSSVLTEIGIKDNPYTDLYKTIVPTVITNTDFSALYSNGSFDSGYSAGLVRSYFGASVKYGSSSNLTYRAYDYHYVGGRTDPITAVNDGKVVYVGTTSYTGGLIVVDHGYGLLSWYWNIGNVKDGISAGSIVKKGDTLAYNGGGGLSEKLSAGYISCHIAMTVFDTPFDMAGLKQNGLIIQDK